MSNDNKLVIFKDNAVTALLIAAKEFEEQWQFLSTIDDIARNPDNLLHLDWRFGSEPPRLEGRVSADGENAVAIHRYLGSMSPVEYSSNRLWTYLSTVEFREYTSERWPLNRGKNPRSRAQDRWVMRQASLQSISRNAISRLWLAAERFFDGELKRPLARERQDPYAYVRFLFGNQDRFQQLFERGTLLHKELGFVILEYLAADPKRSSSQFAKVLNREILARTGFSEVEVLSRDDLYELVGEVGVVIR